MLVSIECLPKEAHDHSSMSHCELSVEWRGAQQSTTKQASLRRKAGHSRLNLPLGQANSPPASSCLMLQADTPSRMSRQGAARTYHTYLSWGYFQRRMAQQRETASASLSSSSSPADAGLRAPQACCMLLIQGLDLMMQIYVLAGVVMMIWDMGCLPEPTSSGKVGLAVLYC